MKTLLENLGGYVVLIFFLLMNFPGGVIIMALSCNTSRLDAWDWFLSVIVPGYGLFVSLFFGPCLRLI